MQYKFLKVSFGVMVFSVAMQSHALTIDASIQTSSQNQALQDKKQQLNQDIENKVKTCKCLVTVIDRKENLFPKKTSKGVPSHSEYLQYISDMKINAGKAQTSAKKIVTEWPQDKSPLNDFKNLDVKVSEELRALSSFCTQPVTAIAQHITNLSNGKEKLDFASCGVEIKLQPPVKKGFFSQLK
jgi:trehalose/maltose hydrolase-like predicted phosphorylase